MTEALRSLAHWIEQSRPDVRFLDPRVKPEENGVEESWDERKGRYWWATDATQENLHYA